MPHLLPPVHTEVLVVGAGPVGLALAGDLGWRGRQALLIDKGDGSIFQPKMDLVGIRTMEFCRRWGLVDAVEQSAYDRDYPQDNVYLTSLTGYELGRQAMPSMRDEQPPPQSPQKRERCPQNMFDPILRNFAQSQPGVSLRYQTELAGFEADRSGVRATARDLLTGDRQQIHARYLVGCDGGKSMVREQLGIGMQGRGLLSYTTNIIFKCPQFNQLHDKAPGYRYMFVGPKGTWATIVAINGKDQWRMSIIGNAQEKRTYTESELKDFACLALGRRFEMEILSVLPWQRAELVADSYGEGQVFICGDACHLTSPTGGLGMNTGIGDAVDLSWKLAANLEGWGGPQLLTSYGVERRPVAQRITQFSTSNLETMRQVPSSPHIAEDSAEGERVRERVGQAMTEGLKKEWFSLNMHLGNRYLNSPINIYSEQESADAQQAEFDDAIHYRPSTRAGCRAPHVWLAPGKSTLDLLGRGFVLFANEVDSTLPMAQAASDLGVPLSVEQMTLPTVREAFQKPLVLVRPDGHVAWRSGAMPADPRTLLQTVSGNIR